MARNNINIYVVDTHPLVWYLEGSSKLSVSAKQAIDEIDRGDSLGIVPSIVLAEIIHLSDKRKISVSVEYVVGHLLQAPNFGVFPLDLMTIMLMIPLKNYELHDRVIMATAKSLNCPLITKDEQIQKSGLTCIW